MKDKQIIVTGATSGIGKEVAMQLGAMGAAVVLPVRDMARGKQVAEEIEKQEGAGRVQVMEMDQSSQASIRAFAEKYLETHERLDALINNAGMNRGRHEPVKSPDGIELTFATNVIGYFLLTQELLGLLKASAPARIVNVASEFASDLDLDDLEFEKRPFEASKAYAQSKACDRLLTWAFARRLKGSGVTVNAMTPGLVVDTGLYRHAPPGLVERLRGFSDRTIPQGADTAVWLASSDEVEGVSNRFYVDRKVTACQFRKKADEEKLWSICEQLTGEHHSLRGEER